MHAAKWHRGALIVLFALFVVVNGAYLHRMPGLLGDEASEGENVYLLFDAKQITITGERSYIGPLLDYVRVPFILAFGYTALSLRIITFLFSAATFWLAVVVCERLWGREAGLLAATALLFSPIYITYQRLGWAITLFPFFASLILYLLTTRSKDAGAVRETLSEKVSPALLLLAGLVGGIAVHNHVLFIPTLVGLAAAWLVAMIAGRRWRAVAWAWTALVGFAAGFGTQLAVMLLNRDDFRDAVSATNLYADRLRELPDALPMLLSGSSFVAHYTGNEFSPATIQGISLLLIALMLAALVIPVRRRTSWLWLFGLLVLLGVLLYLVFQFSLRYFVMFTLGMWALAGAGSGSILVWLAGKPSHKDGMSLEGGRATAWSAISSVVIAFGLSAWMAVNLFLPFLTTGGQTNEFSIGTRTDSAAAFVDTRPLLACLAGAGPVYSENVHIHNRLRYFSYNPDNRIEVVAENESKRRAQWIVSYRLQGEANPYAEFEKCSELKHFKVIARDRG